MYVWHKQSLPSSRCGQCPQVIRPRTALAPPQGGGILKKIPIWNLQFSIDQ